MKFVFHEKLYTEGMSSRKIKSIRNKVMKGSFKLGIFLITLPLVGDGILEVYWYPELLQSIYKKSDDNVIVIGIAESREDAFSLVERIIRDVGILGGQIPIADYFGG